MPPTRGHDLKLAPQLPTLAAAADAPHTGARLETRLKSYSPAKTGMPPTRGHDLKHSQI